jgi:succinyl-diaminopimelate desuccinylase
MTRVNTFNRLCERIDQYQEYAIDLQKSLIPIIALGPENGGEGEHEKAKYVKQILKDLNISTITDYNAPDTRIPRGDRPNFIAMAKGKKSDETLWILAHLDIVPAGDLKHWKTEPFKAFIQDDKIYGRGSEDNNQGLVSALLTLKAFQELDIKPTRNIGLLIVSDEETGSQYGLAHVLRSYPQGFKDNDLVIVPDAGEQTGTMIEVAEKSILWVKFKIMGRSCHASTPELGINPHRASAHLIVELEHLNKIFDKQDKVFDPPISTFEPTKKELNVPNINTVPADDIFYLDCRILPQYSVDFVIEEIEKKIKTIEEKFNVKIETSYPQKVKAAPPTPGDSRVVTLLADAITHVKKKPARCYGIGGGTVASFFRESGLATAVWSTIDDTAHQPNEYARLSNIVSDAQVFAYVALED